MARTTSDLPQSGPPRPPPLPKAAPKAKAAPSPKQPAADAKDKKRIADLEKKIALLEGVAGDGDGDVTMDVASGEPEKPTSI